MKQIDDGEKYLKLEPPKIYYFISEDGDMWSEEDLDGTLEKKRKIIGNYFESEEEVRKAYKKLLAWKRLKDKGFEFETWFGGSKDISFWIGTEIDENIAKDLDLLFGGEE